ncbi:STAS domain-containing protein [Leptospira stimsonii]|uniref:Anti-sigma factor antagonist n=1 Tax=Leptospira stimsonii TaxID=2202203 RepID=A0A4R9L8U5_9LEPT|nr:STAS domain-containing protein [Leptospira stimsonii]RHX84201.1 anti-sigma factor antagonist [Leptospira stimsonii]RHX89408.1 anti-sigma factor antagonist [Leptospira stimsonii]TGK26047.1 anti-sigma factor antagonist [Leptospira stimsonii]TGM22480.1 anti-sigma factor antagonist [Leptospira stimsonii]
MTTTNNSKDELSVEIVSNSHVQQSLKPNISIIKAKGEINIFSSKKLKDVFTDKIDEGVTVLLLDLSETTHIDSSGLAVLISTQAKLMKQVKGGLVLYSIPSSIMKIFELTRLDKLISMVIDLDAAVDKGLSY